MYNFKAWPELVWAVVIAAASALLMVLVDFDAALVEDWEFWAISVGSGVARAVAVAALAVIGKATFTTEDKGP